MNIANMPRINHDYLYLINSMFSCLYLISPTRRNAVLNSFTCVTCHMAAGLLVVTKHYKTELLMLSTSIKHQNIAKALLYYIYFLVTLNIPYADTAVMAS